MFSIKYTYVTVRDLIRDKIAKKLNIIRTEGYSDMLQYTFF